MNFKRLVTSASIAATTLAFAALPVLAAVGQENPNLTVQLTIVPTVVTAPAQVTATGTITNNTNKTNRVVAKVSVVSPSGVTSTYTEKYILGPGQTVSETITYTVPADAEKGTYIVTLSATDKKGTSHATEYVTVQ